MTTLRRKRHDDSDPWHVDESDYPRSGALEERLRFLVRYAVLAPSSHNAQPWLFRIREGAIELLADRTRALPVVDPDDRELCIGCGAALFHLLLAATHFEGPPRTDVLPDSDNPDLLARVWLDGGGDATAAEHEMFASISLRRTSRAHYNVWPVPDDVLAELAAGAVAENAWLHVFDEGGRERVAELVAEGDRVQWSDPCFRRELAAWLHPNRARSRDGIPLRALGYGELAARAAALLVRTFDRGDGQAARDRQLALGSPALALLGTAADVASDWLTAGRALARVLLQARVRGVSASFLNQPIEVPALRPRLVQLAGRSGHPQILLRLGYGPEVPPTPRRDLSAVLA